jgi:hypothetical protein
VPRLKCPLRAESERDIAGLRRSFHGIAQGHDEQFRRARLQEEYERGLTRLGHRCPSFSPQQPDAGGSAAYGNADGPAQTKRSA